ncbi:hypothetical protein AWU65_25190 [Paenibacillus glucanolyticus]|uniref:Immunity protein 7 n=1 Tax=Paenibacillus glucanolyticus TaxID=59843 RepID=A0A163DSL0_9BACL|nr:MULTISPECIES: immunity 7 family protein [Paenibacillus]AWP27264.1 hypothetical protein B9D94_11790 [Paenibacillus sp. Cedars]KZS43408.1 hypothetical protein AWU65_25190 [Paenibacillus glucanolyticus]
MYEFHGWATIQENPAEIDAGQLDAIIQKIQLKITEFAWGSGLLSLNAANGSYYLHVGGFTNRKGVEADEVVSLYQLIGEIAPGSYGLLYTRDDENTEGFDNEFRVSVLARGRLQEQHDPFLSPCIPVIEDELD